ncbi:fibronectin type III domain-containing protein [Gaopeijia maritima]|uniref:Fibronectin type III domain-containing protein n=1 Tax=Gaopeijia maritima TaxID=3119007 RepID=A0ABU9EAS7_9BACT
MFRSGRWILPALVATTVVAGACSDDDDPVDTTPDAPAAPVNVVVTEQDGDLMVSWGASTGADSYTVQRQVASSGSSFSTLAADLTATTYTDMTAAEGTGYNYRVIAIGEGGQSNPSDPAYGEIGVRAAVLGGTITGTRQLSADTTYTIAGLVIVEDGGELRIPAGTTLLGSTTVQPSAVIVRQGGQLYSEGTAAAPVVFTSDKVNGTPGRGDWGGVVLNGRSICNFPAGECVGEGNSGPYGGDQLDDNSGRIVYTRIEYAGYEVSFGNELNALTLNGVGSETEIHHVQTHFGSDDGFEWFGGTVNAKYLLATGISDDSFDYSTGWQGKGQFWIAQQDPNDADNGFEVDGNEDNFDNTPYTEPTLFNITLIGKGPNGTGGTSGESTAGMLHRRGTGGQLNNIIVMGFERGLDIDNAETVARIGTGNFALQNSIIFSNAVNFDGDGDGIDEQAIFNTAGWNNREVDPGLTNPFDRSNPDFRPAAGSAATTGAASVPAGDDFFTAVDFVGAVGPGAEEWYKGWTRLTAN